MEMLFFMKVFYIKTCLKRKKKTNICFQDRLLLNAGQKYCRMLQREHSAILSTFIKLPFVIKIFVLTFFEWLLKTGFTVFGGSAVGMTNTLKIDQCLKMEGVLERSLKLNTVLNGAGNPLKP